MSETPEQPQQSTQATKNEDTSKASEKVRLNIDS